MKMISLMVAAFVWLAPLAVLPAADVPKAPAKPNVVYMLADDLGWSDLSAHPGGTIPTPHIDRLFQQGVELRNFMGWCVCSPTRAMLMTGRHPYRVGTGPETGGELAKEETTMAEGFKAHGYRTGIFGKWHNGENPDTPEYLKAYEEAYGRLSKTHRRGGLGVNAHGFDEAWVYYGGSVEYFTRRMSGGRGPVSWWHSLWPVLTNAKALWPDRLLVHHVGRWAKGKAAESKYTGCSIQNSRFTLVKNSKLYDLKADPGETRNVIAEHPEVVAELRAAYDQWWAEVQPLLVNENVTGPKINPFKELYWKQFGGGPDEALLQRMNPDRSAEKANSPKQRKSKKAAD